ncbi:MAG TPA: hypothetical protein ENK18_16285 [Deltaproteobacteria bacterium]|nr:hypothetical protein [Deltaproteobacteria bacterium]
MPLASLILALVACQEYELYQPNKGEDPIDSGTEPDAEPDTATPVDTGSPAGVADAPVYANTSGQLFEVEPNTGERTLVGDFRLQGQPVQGMVDIAIDLSGRMFGGTSDALYQIDASNATLAKICDTDLNPYALAFTSDGVLFAGADAEIVSVELSSCDTRALATSGGYSTSGDLVGLPDGFLYWTVRGVGTDAPDELVRVDPVTGAAFWVGTLTEDRLYGLGYDEGQLYGFSSNGVILQIDPQDAGSSIVSVDLSTSWWGATTNPVVW